MAVKTFNERPEGFNIYPNHEGKNVRLDPTLAHNVLSVVEAAKSTNGDVIIAIDGEEGSGKTTLGMQLGKLIDPNLTEKAIEFSPEDAKNAHFRGLPERWDPITYMEGGYENKPWSVIILDESAKLDRKNTMTANSKDFTGFLSQSRQLHKIFIIILPSVHMLESYVAEHRAVFLLHCYKHMRTGMGFYRWYTRKHIKKIFGPVMHRQKMYCKEHAFHGRFSSVKPFDDTAYQRKKAAALNAYRKAEESNGEGKTPEEIISDYEKKCVNRFMTKVNKNDASVFTTLGIPMTSWKRMKKAWYAENGITPPKKGVAARV